MKKAKILIAIILFGSLTWYLFFKQYDYIVRFRIKTSPGTLFTAVEEWNLSRKEKENLEYIIKEKKPFTFLHQSLKTDSLDLNVDWKFKSINDSITQVIAGISEPKNSVYNRITAPFSNTFFKETIIDVVEGFKYEMEYQLKTKYKVKYIGLDSISEINYAYIESKNINLRDKALEMMKNNAMLLGFITQHKLKGGEYPFLIINNWDLNKSIIDFRFCFPIKYSESLPINKDIKFDVLKPRQALKAVYNGNYMTSDRAWFALHEYAKRHTINIENKPLEIFYNNPHNGGDELKWKAEVFMPIK